MRALTILGVSIAVAGLGACSSGSGDPEPAGKTSQAVRTAARTVPVTDNPYTLFETLQVRPLALSRDGTHLYALNTPDNRLEIFRVDRTEAAVGRLGRSSASSRSPSRVRIGQRGVGRQSPVRLA